MGGFDCFLRWSFHSMLKTSQMMTVALTKEIADPEVYSEDP
jgi:hypothetical protein